LGYKNEKRQEEPSIIAEQGQKYEIEQEIAKAFNKYYVNMAKNLRNEFEDIQGHEHELGDNGDLSGNIAKDVEDINNRGLLIKSFKELHPKTRRHIISSLKINAAAGTDQIPARIIKNYLNALLQPITLVNLSLQTGCFPEQFKEALIRPIYKTGEISGTVNYRPISLISNILKILEKAVLH